MFYFDTSFLTPLFRTESTTAEIGRFVSSLPPISLATSQWTRIEFASLLARDVRMGGVSAKLATEIDDRFQSRVSESFEVSSPAREDFELARRYLRDHKTSLRAGAALHLAVARNNRAETIYTLDKGMLKAGRHLGLPVSTGVKLAGYAS